MLAVLLSAAAVTGGIVFGVARPDPGAPEIVRGTVRAVNEDVSAVSVSLGGRHYEVAGDGEGLQLVHDVPWTTTDGKTRSGDEPACLAPGSSGQRVELALLDVGGQGNWPDRVVVSVRCLS